MKKFNFSFSLLLLAMLVRFLVCFPILFWGAVQGGEVHYNGNALLAMTMVILVGYAGFAMRSLQQKYGQKNVVPVKWNILFYLTGILLSAGTVAGSLLCGFRFFLAVVTVACSYFCFLVGGRCRYRDYGEILYVNILYRGATYQIASMLLLGIFGKKYSLNLPIIVFTVTVILYALVGNQANIDHMMDRRKHSRSFLPKQVRQYNVLLLGIFSGIGCVLLLAKDILTEILGILGIWLGKIGLVLMRFFMMILDFLLFNSSSESSESSDSQIEEKLDGLLESKDSLFSPVWILVILIVLLLIWKHREIFAFLNRCFHKLPIFKRMPAPSEYYEDTVEWLPKEEKEELREKKKGRSRRWKKEFSLYQKMERNIEKFRYGYSLLVRWLVLRGTEIEVSDTTLEILRKGRACLEPLSGEEVTDDYNRLRYGEMEITPEDFEQMDMLLRELSGYRIKG